MSSQQVLLSPELRFLAIGLAVVVADGDDVVAAVVDVPEAFELVVGAIDAQVIPFRSWTCCRSSLWFPSEME